MRLGTVKGAKGVGGGGGGGVVASEWEVGGEFVANENRNFNPFTLGVPVKCIVCYSHTFENNLGMKQNFTKYLI